MHILINGQIQTDFFCGISRQHHGRGQAVGDLEAVR